MYRILIVLFLLTGCGFFLSGSFILHDSSELPKWLKSKEKLNRSDYKVEIYMYEPILSRPPKVKIFIKDINDNLIDKAVGIWEWHPESLKKMEQGNRNPPVWIVIKIRSTEEVYEQSVTGDILKITIKEP